MKKRNGFVSNSSTSSFVILGVKKPVPDDCWDDYDEAIHGFDIDETKEHVYGKLIQHGETYDWELPRALLLNMMSRLRVLSYILEYGSVKTRLSAKNIWTVSWWGSSNCYTTRHSQATRQERSTEMERAT